MREHRTLKVVPGAPLEVLTQDRSEPPAVHTKKECRTIVKSGLHPDPCEAMDSSSLPGASPAANEPVENEHPPQGLPETKTLAPICAPPYPDES